MEKGKIGIVCLANGPYAIFIDGLIISCEDNFLKEYKKEYFIITDSEFKHSKDDNCTVVYKKRYGWPLDGLLRSKYSYELKEKIEHLDYIYFFNSNMIIRSEVGEDILPNESGLVGVDHPQQCVSRDNLKFPYDRNPKTNGYIPFGEGKIYYQACLWGGTTSAFLELSKTLSEWADEDLAKGVEPSFLDESYLNRYFIIHQPKILSPAYAWPVHRNGSTSFPSWMQIPKLNEEIKIIQFEKTEILPLNFKFVKK